MTEKELFTEKYITLAGMPIIIDYLMADPNFEGAFKEASVQAEVADIAVQKQLIAQREAKVAIDLEITPKEGVK